MVEVINAGYNCKCDTFYCLSGNNNKNSLRQYPRTNRKAKLYSLHCIVDDKCLQPAALKRGPSHRFLIFFSNFIKFNCHSFSQLNFL